MLRCCRWRRRQRCWPTSSPSPWAPAAACWWGSRWGRSKQTDWLGCRCAAGAERADPGHGWPVSWAPFCVMAKRVLLPLAGVCHRQPIWFGPHAYLWNHLGPEPRAEHRWVAASAASHAAGRDESWWQGGAGRQEGCQSAVIEETEGQSPVCPCRLRRQLPSECHPMRCCHQPRQLGWAGPALLLLLCSARVAACGSCWFHACPSRRSRPELAKPASCPRFPCTPAGGPLLDSRGRLIGINTAIADPTGKGASSGIGFAIPIDTGAWLPCVTGWQYATAGNLL